MLKKKLLTLGLSVIMLIGTAKSALAYSVMIAQGNTNGIDDCVVVFEAFSQNSSYNGNKSNRGWTYSGANGKPTINSKRANSDDFKAAASMDVLYWSGHGGKSTTGGPILNFIPKDPTKASGNAPVFYIKDTLKLSNGNNLWAGGNLKVVMLSACNQLDKDTNGAKWYAKAMKTSNVRVITGYHMTAPTSPYDSKIAAEFMKQAQKGKSVRSAWQIANSNYAKARWAALVYQSNNNQYYRLPGFPGKTYPAPDKTQVYRYREDSKGNAVEHIPAEINQLPLVLVSSGQEATLNVSALGEERMAMSANEEIFVVREMEADSLERFTMGTATQQTMAENILNTNSFGENVRANAILDTSEVIVSEIDDIIEEVPGSDVVIGKTFTYSNQFNGVRIADNFVKIATDKNGVYYVVNMWSDLAPAEDDERQPHSQERITREVASQIATSKNPNADLSLELVYALQADGQYHLSYEVDGGDTVFYVDCATGAIL